MAFTEKLHTERVPPDTEHERVVGGSIRSVPLGLVVMSVVNETDVSSVLNPVPDTVIVVPVGPKLDENVTMGPPVTVNVLKAEVTPPTLVTVTK